MKRFSGVYDEVITRRRRKVGDDHRRILILQADRAYWLVVLDDLGDPADLRGWWPPESRHGLVLTTTHRRVAELSGESRSVVDVGLYTASESLA